MLKLKKASFTFGKIIKENQLYLFVELKLRFINKICIFFSYQNSLLCL